MSGFKLLAAALLLSNVLFSQDLVRFYENGKVGYKTAGSAVIVAPIYDAGSDFFEGYALVLQQNKRGFIDETGKIFIPIPKVKQLLNASTARLMISRKE